MKKIVECVPNFSEGRDLAKIEEIRKAILSVKGVTLLDVDPGNATNRTVVTIVGEPDAVGEAAFRSIKKAAEIIDMSGHKGEHPRMGATDVCPFVPVANMSMEEAVELSKKVAKRVGKELNIPVFLYEYSASNEKRKSLAYIREGEYEKMAEKIITEEFKPDFGPQDFNVTAGCTAIGAREFLIAYNLNLNTTDVKLANKIAKRIREKGWKEKQADGSRKQVPGLLKSVRAVGWFIEEYGVAQISVNLINYKVTPLWKLFEAAEEVGRQFGIRITGSELVGLIPLQALRETGEHFLQKTANSTAIPERDILKIGVLSMGLSELYPFKLEEKVIEYKIAEEGILSSMRVDAFCDELSSNSPAPGGGSVAALSGALAASLLSMVANLTHGKKKYKDAWEEIEKAGRKAQDIKSRLVSIVDSDTVLFNEFMAVRGMPKSTEEQKELRKKALEQASLNITLSPLELLRVMKELIFPLRMIAEKGNVNSISDAGVAASMLRAGAESALLNVLINLPSLSDSARADEIKIEADALYAELLKGSQEIFEQVKNDL